MLRYLAAGAVLVVMFIAFRACVAPVPNGQFVHQATSNGGIVYVNPAATCGYRYAPLPDITAYEVARIQLGMNDPRHNPDRVETAALARHFRGVPCE